MLRRQATTFISGVLVVIGLVLIGKAAFGGGPAAIVVGIFFALAGLGRLYLSRR